MRIIYVVLLIISIITLIAAYGFIMYNKLVILRHDVDDAWQQVNLEIKNCFDLITNVQNSLNGIIMDTDMQELRQILMAYPHSINVENCIKSYLSLKTIVDKLLFAIDNNLSSSEYLKNLSTMLRDNGQKLDRARIIYNDNILKLNTRIELFPNNFLAQIFHFYKWPFFSE